MLALLLAIAPAWAQETVDIGVIRAAEVMVVQDMLYPKDGRTEVGGSFGLITFDPYLVTPNVQASMDLHRSERMSFGVVGGAGYGLPTAELRQLSSPTYQVVPDAYRYLASVLAGAGWSPLYGKMSVSGNKVVHYDGYLAARGGATLEQSIIPTGGVTLAPTVSGALGARIFLGNDRALRIELRDDVLLEHRRLTGKTYVKQNVNVQVGLTLLSARKP